MEREKMIQFFKEDIVDSYLRSILIGLGIEEENIEKLTMPIMIEKFSDVFSAENLKEIAEYCKKLETFVFLYF